MITKEQLEEAFKLLKHDPHYYVDHKGGIEELYEEINNLKEQISALDGFADSLDIIERDTIAKNLTRKNETHKNN